MSHQVATLSGLVPSDATASSNAIIERDVNGDDVSNTRTCNNGLIVGGYTKLKAQTKSATFTVDEVTSAVTNGTVFLCDSTSGSVTVNLPAAASSTNRVIWIVKTVAANSVIIDPSGAELINGAATKTSTGQYATYAIVCDGTAWYSISNTGTWT